MKQFKNVAISELTWQEARAKAQAVNPEFTQLVDELDPGPDFKLYLARYPYGAKFLHNGEFLLPDHEGGLIPFVDERVEEEVKESLSYNLNTNPVTMVLHNSLEMFITLEDRVVPFRLNAPGNVFGLWRVLDRPDDSKLSHTSVFIWDMTAGARSIFLLPKTSEALAHNKLKQSMRISVEKPRDMRDHWKVFKEIASSPEFTEDWHVEVLFFSKKWIEYMLDPAWIKLRYYLLEKTWEGTQFWRNQFVWNLTFSRIQSLKKIKASPYINDVVQHILAIGTGAIPGFRPAYHDTTLAPIKGIQQAYLDHYELKNYAPVIMQPSVFDAKSDEKPVYYSLQYPTALELSPKTSGRSSAISDLYDIRALMNKYINQILGDGLNIEATPLYELARIINFDYYHSNVELYAGMKSTDALPEDDATFAAIMKEFPDLEFPKNSAFFKGAISIHR